MGTVPKRDEDYLVDLKTIVKVKHDPEIYRNRCKTADITMLLFCRIVGLNFFMVVDMGGGQNGLWGLEPAQIHCF